MITRCIQIVIFAISICFIICSCEQEKQEMKDPAFKSEIERRLGIAFPTSLVWIGSQLDRGMDYMFLGVFALPKKDIVYLIPGKELNWNDHVRYLWNIKGGPVWFDPDSIKRFRSIETRYPTDNCVLKILYDDSVSSSARTTVYIQWFEVS